jgi:hypothetical protein
VHRRIAVAHLCERLLRRDAAIHHPHASGLAVLAFDAIVKVAQGGFVGGVARLHIPAHREYSFRFNVNTDSGRT